MGFDVHIRALGDRAVRESLNAIEIAQKANPKLVGKRRHQLTHLAVVRPDDIPRFAKLGVSANIQINFEPDYVDTGDTGMDAIDYQHVSVDDPDFWFKILGDVDVLFTPVLEINQSDGLVVLSSDWDVASIDPLVSIKNLAVMYQGVKPKDELVALAIQAYTKNAAYVMHHDDMTGSIEVGKYADIIVLNKNLLALPVEKISEAKVLQTFLAGKEVYRASGVD